MIPSFVAVDLSNLLIKESKPSHTSNSLMQKVTLCTVSLLTYMQSIAEQIARRRVNVSSDVTALLILHSDLEDFGATQIQTLKDLYFYKTELYKDFKELRTKLMLPPVEY